MKQCKGRVRTDKCWFGADNLAFLTRGQAGEKNTELWPLQNPEVHYCFYNRMLEDSIPNQLLRSGLHKTAPKSKSHLKILGNS